MIDSLDSMIPFSKRHKGETIREIIEYDSGYLKDLFLKNEELVFSQACFDEICKLTKGHKDNWKPIESDSIFSKLKPYAVPYLYDFNRKNLRDINNVRLKELIQNR